MIHALTIHDLPEVMDLLETFHAESPHYSQNTVADRGHTEWMIRSMLQQDYLSGFLHWKDAKINGVFLGSIGPSWYSPTIEANEMLLYVPTEHRSDRRIAIRLIRAFEAEAIDKGAVVINAGSSAGYNNEGVARLYERLGYNRSAAVGVYKNI